MTNQACHHFLQAPSTYSYIAAMRWGHLVSLGCSDEVAQTIISIMDLGTHKDPFWLSVYQLFGRQNAPRASIRTVIDYIKGVKFALNREPNGSFRIAQPDFQVKGRTVPSLLRGAAQWHRELNQRSGELPPI